jgi:hypothetical protein
MKRAAGKVGIFLDKLIELIIEQSIYQLQVISIVKNPTSSPEANPHFVSVCLAKRLR